MKSFLLTTSFSGAGHLKRVRTTDEVVGMEQRLVSGPLPTRQETTAYFAPRDNFDEHANGHHWQALLSMRREEELGRFRPGLIEAWEKFERIELWVDPFPNAQLMLLQLLDFLRPHSEIVRKLLLCHADRIIAEQDPDAGVEWYTPMEKVEEHHIETAALAWEALHQPTPEAWFGLLDKDLEALPYLRPTVLELLEELPGKTSALGETEMTLLRLISPGEVAPYDTFPGHKKDNTRRVFGYWEVGQLLDQLAHCPNPAVLGLAEGPFTLEMHDDPDRRKRYTSSKLSLSPLGEALVENRDDFSAHNPIHRWWGGTELTNGHLWRWDAENKSLVSPG